MAASLQIKSLHLHTAPFSGCSARVRTALNLKSPTSAIPISHHILDVGQKDHQSPSYAAINPNLTVPALVVEYRPSAPHIASALSYSGATKTFTITQSSAILDLIETIFPEPILLPGPESAVKRAKVLELVALVACDIQPPQTLRIRERIKKVFGGDGEEWARWVYERGFGVYETLIVRERKESGEVRYSVGDEVSWADLYLLPAVQGALRVGVNLEKWPAMKGIVDECWMLEAFRNGGLGGHGRLKP